MKNKKGNFGNPLSKNCNHIFETDHWRFKKCIKCGAVDRTYDYTKYGKRKTKPLLQRIFNHD